MQQHYANKMNRSILPLLPLPQQQIQNYIYPPGDDTYLLLWVLFHEFGNWKQYPIILEIGSGSGIISANISKWLKQKNNTCTLQISIDINPDASIASQHYYSLYASQIIQINTSIIKNTRLNQIGADIVIFNPPYIPIPEQQQNNQKQYLTAKFKNIRQSSKIQQRKQQNIIAYSYMGGKDGLKIIRSFLYALNWSCIAYFIVLGQESVNVIIQQIKIAKQLLFHVQFQLMHSQQFYNEHLFVIKLILKNKQQ